MRDFQLQTPQRDQTSANRRSKSTSNLNRNLRKVTQKSLNHPFQAVAEDDSSVLESLKEFSETCDDNPFGESAEDEIVEPEQRDHGPRGRERPQRVRKAPAWHKDYFV